MDLATTSSRQGNVLEVGVGVGGPWPVIEAEERVGVCPGSVGDGGSSGATAAFLAEILELLLEGEATNAEVGLRATIVHEM